MIDTLSRREQARAGLKPWKCEGEGRGDDDWRCRRLLMELDPACTSKILKVCDRCRAWNVWENGRGTLVRLED